MKLTKLQSIFILLVFVMTSYVQHAKYIDLDIQGIHAWRQSQTMWNIRNFVRHDNNILNPRSNRLRSGKTLMLRYEFPIMQWGIAQFQRVFGEGISVTRNLIFIIGIFSIFCLFGIVQILFENWLTSLVTAILFMYTPLFFSYTINPLPDNLALCGGLFYIYFILKHRDSEKFSHLILAGLFLLLATLSKLPYLMFSILSITFFFHDIIKNKKVDQSLIKYALIQLLLIVPAFAWYLWVMPNWTNNPVLMGFGDNFVLDEYLKIATYHVNVMFPYIILSQPTWILVVLGLLSFLNNWRSYAWIFSLIVITFVYLLLEFKPIGVGHDYYMMPFLPWLFFVIGFGVHLINRFKYGIILLGILCNWSINHTPKVTKRMWQVETSYLSADLFKYSEELKNAVPNHEPCIIFNDKSRCVFSYRIDKIGYIYGDDSFKPMWIKDLLPKHNVKYLYSNSRKIDESAAFQPYIDSTLLIRGDIRVFKLKLPEE